MHTEESAAVAASNPPQTLRARSSAFWQRHESFLLVLLLFVAFRLLAIWLMRPGGFIADASDYDFYVDWGEQSARGYRTFETMWTAYPPLFARLMLPIHELSARIPPWVEPRLAFHSLFGGLLLLFESGNLILLYRLSNKLAQDERDSAAIESSALGVLPPAAAPWRVLHPVIFYALLFVPVHTLLGWFEAMPLFFLLLALDLLLTPKRWGWTGSAVAMALGFLVKLTPIILLPVAIRWLGAKFSWRAAREEWFNPQSSSNLLRPTIYILLSAATILGVGWLLVNGNTSLATSSLQVNSIRPPWQSMWALIDGYWSYGWVPLDMRNLDGLQQTLWETRLPWTWITVAFVALYLWLYTRPYDWTRIRTVIAFTGVSVVWMFLYSKGWSPQFLVWILAFIVLLLPNLRGIMLALTLSVINLVESYIFLIILPNERWILVATVLLRTLLLVLVAVEFLAQIWHAGARGVTMRRWTAGASWLLVAAAILTSIIGAPRMAQAYGDRRLGENPCYEAITFLREQAATSPLTTKIATTEIEVWRNLYPWLRDDYDLRVIDSYTSNDYPEDAAVSERLIEYVGTDEFWWVYTDHAPEPTPQNISFFDEEIVRDFERLVLGDCHVERHMRLPDASLSGGNLASAAVPAAPALGAVGDDSAGAIELQQAHVGEPQPGSTVPLVLYWQATGTITDSWTVFTQLLDSTGALVAQQDNLPVNGLAPTNTWEPYNLVRDPYMLQIPASAQPGPFQLVIGLYNEAGQRATLTLPDGTTGDQYSVFSIR